MAESAGPGRWIPLAGLVLLALVPPLAGLFDQPYLISLFNRAVILAIAAIGLDLILGFGGMVSFGHAAFLGVGGYVAGILAHHAFEETAVFGWPFTLPGAESALVLWPAAAVESALSGNGSCLLGWRRASRRNSGGAALGPGSFGHVSFTGGSLWIDPGRRGILILLAHRANTGVELAPLRRRFHAAALAG